MVAEIAHLFQSDLLSVVIDLVTDEDQFSLEGAKIDKSWLICIIFCLVNELSISVKSSCLATEFELRNRTLAAFPYFLTRRSPVTSTHLASRPSFDYGRHLS